MLLLPASVTGARAQDSPADRWPLRGDLFFLESPFNQDPGTVQTFVLVTRWRDDPRDRWDAQLVQQWPLGSLRHQFSYTIPFSWTDGGAQNGLEDIGIGYNYQWLTETDSRPAVAPGVTLLLPTADEDGDQGRGELGWEVVLPIGKAFGNVYAHVNLGSRSRTGVEPTADDDAGDDGDGEYLWTPFVAAATAFRLHPNLNLLLETLAEFQDAVTGPDSTDRDTRWILSPGFRAGWQRGSRSIVFGAAVPFGLTDAAEDVGVLGYLSVTLPFR